MNAPPFKNRWLITGTITTTSELHIGDGGAGALHNRSRLAKKHPEVELAKEEPDASTVCVDCKGSAYIPGSGIKGTLRSLILDQLDREENEVWQWRKRNKTKTKGEREDRPKTSWSELLGSGSPDSGGAVGGKLEFWDAFHVESGKKTKENEQPDQKKLYGDQDHKRPYWNATRKTCVAVANSLDRRTRTSADNLLYHIEYVPAGEAFKFQITGENIEKERIEEFLKLLAHLHNGTARLGALESNGWGRVQISDLKVKCFTADDLGEWKKDQKPLFDVLPRGSGSCPDPDLCLECPLDLGDSETLIIDLRVIMESPWLVRDPRQGERSDEAKKQGSLQEDQKPSDAVPIHDEDGKPFVPAKSFRGALRSQAEMILRTLDLLCEDHPNDINPISSKGIGAKDAIKLIRDGGRIKDKDIPPKDLAAKLFGFGGWKAPIDVLRLEWHGEFREAENEQDQEFVAIDRFTGGAADGAKFNATLAGATTLVGKLIIDRARLREVDPDEASLGLLALVLRDLAEGDIPIGSGSAKGQGFCTAEVIWNGKSLFDPDCEAFTLVREFQASLSANESPEKGNPEP